MIAIFVLCLVGTAMSQRPTYLSSSSAEYPGLLPRFRTNDSGNTLENRFGANDSRAPQEATADGTLFDRSTIDRVAQWPKDKQPFWYVNRAQIAQHRGTQQQGNATH